MGYYTLKEVWEYTIERDSNMIAEDPAFAGARERLKGEIDGFTVGEGDRKGASEG